MTPQTQLFVGAALLLASLAVFGQELGEPLVGAEILPQTVQLEHNRLSACTLQSAGDVFCWRNFVPLVFLDDFPADEAGFETLNEAL